MVQQDVICNCIWESAKETFETMIFLPIEQADGTIGQPETTSLIGTITFTGSVQGSFSILCRMEGAEKIARAMLMLEPDDALEEADLGDAFGELTNLVIGGIKTRLNETVSDFKISIPTVTQGIRIHPCHRKDATQTDVTANTDGEAMQMTMTYQISN